jgi:membrane protease YdiL (CAAX protease family)
MNKAMKYPIIFAALAIAITLTLDATGYAMFSALPLAPLMALFWFLEKFSRAEIGFKLGRPGAYGLAVLYPLVVVGAAVAIAALAGEVQATDVDWAKAAKNMALITFSTVIVAMITEEGFFRGVLWASFKKGGLSDTQVLLWSSVVFAIWHLPFVTLAEGFEMAPAFIPIFILNATLLGAVWGALRMLSGSIVVASVSHGVWNGIVYVFFGASSTPGVLGIPEGALFGPETGIVGLALNAAFLLYLLRLWKKRTAA